MAGLGFKAAWDFGRAVAGLARGGESARSATVTSVDEDGTVWVRMAGAESDVPLDGTLASAQVGDTVTVGWRGGAPAGEGNASDPSAGGRSVSVVRESARIAQAVAQEAQAVADAINQHFFTDANGIHVTEAEGDPATGHNILINSLGILLRHATSALVSITQSAIAFYDGAGTAAGNIVASFGSSGFQVGKGDESHLVGDYHSLQLIDKDGGVYFHVNDLRDEDGYAYVTETYPPNFQAYTYNIACPVVAPQGVDNPVSVKVDGTDVSPVSYQNDDSNPFYAGYVYADTSSATASSVISVSYWTTSQAAKTYTAGIRDGNTGAGVMSFASGYEVAASAPYSVALNFCTKAVSRWQTVLGRFNAIDQRDRYALIIGNGVSDAGRSNALALQWDGTMELAKALPTTSGGTGSKAYGSIVTEDISTAVSVPTGSSWHTLGSVDLAAGDWIVSYNVQFESNATGRRAMVLHNAADTAGASNLRQGGMTCNAVSGGATYLNACRVLHLTSAATYYLNVYQTSGAALSTYGYIRAYRLK